MATETSYLAILILCALIQHSLSFNCPGNIHQTQQSCDVRQSPFGNFNKWLKTLCWRAYKRPKGRTNGIQSTRTSEGFPTQWNLFCDAKVQNYPLYPCQQNGGLMTEPCHSTEFSFSDREFDSKTHVATGYCPQLNRAQQSVIRIGIGADVVQFVLICGAVPACTLQLDSGTALVNGDCTVNDVTTKAASGCYIVSENKGGLSGKQCSDYKVTDGSSRVFYDSGHKECAQEVWRREQGAFERNSGWFIQCVTDGLQLSESPLIWDPYYRFETFILEIDLILLIGVCFLCCLCSGMMMFVIWSIYKNNKNC